MTLAIAVLSNFPFAQLIAVRHALCSDGKRRYARITGQPDSFFSVPASVNVKGKTVRGYVTCNDNETNGVYTRDYEFRVLAGKNSALLEGKGE